MRDNHSSSSPLLCTYPILFLLSIFSDGSEDGSGDSSVTGSFSVLSPSTFSNLVDGFLEFEAFLAVLLLFLLFPESPVEGSDDDKETSNSALTAPFSALWTEELEKWKHA